MKKSKYFLILLISCLSNYCFAQDFLPEIVLNDWKSLTQDGGKWISSDNTGDYDAWEMEFTWGLGKKSIDASLYAIKDEKNIGTLWQYKVYYHPVTKKVILEQWGSDGSFGEGTIVIHPSGEIENVSTIFFTNGSQVTMKHVQRMEGDIKNAIVYIKDKSDDWVKDQEYTWKRVK